MSAWLLSWKHRDMFRGILQADLGIAPNRRLGSAVGRRTSRGLHPSRSRWRAATVKRPALRLLSITSVAFAGCVGPFAPEGGTQPLDSTRAYPEGAGSGYIDFAALTADDENVSQSPRQHWDSYAVRYTAPSEQPLVEGCVLHQLLDGHWGGDRRAGVRVTVASVPPDGEGFGHESAIGTRTFENVFGNQKFRRFTLKYICR